MKIEIINIGDELLIGQVLNTNAHWMAARLDGVGFEVVRTTIIKDDKEEIRSNVERALKEADSVLITGGLGPTKDDITKHTLAEVFGTTLVESKEVLDNIRRIFDRRGFELSPTNRLQAMVPKDGTVINNPLGTAPGLCFERDGKLVFSMPGVPFEMKSMMKDSIIPMLSKHYYQISIQHKTLIIQGIGESYLSDRIEDFEDSLPEHFSLAYLSSPNFIRLRLSGKGRDKDELSEELNQLMEKLLPYVEDYLIGYDKEDIIEILIDLLNEEGKTIGIAESCTGGYLSHRFTRIKGASNYYKGGITAYSNQAKINVLGVDKDKIEAHGAVSKEVVEEMAINSLSLFDADYSIATTGIAGPGGESPGKPIGTVWIAVASKKGELVVETFCFSSSRDNFIERASNQGISMLIRMIRKQG